MRYRIYIPWWLRVSTPFFFVLVLCCLAWSLRVAEQLELNKMVYLDVLYVKERGDTSDLREPSAKSLSIWDSDDTRTVDENVQCKLEISECWAKTGQERHLSVDSYLTAQGPDPPTDAYPTLSPCPPSMRLSVAQTVSNPSTPSAACTPLAQKRRTCTSPRTLTSAPISSPT